MNKMLLRFTKECKAIFAIFCVTGITNLILKYTLSLSTIYNDLAKDVNILDESQEQSIEFGE